MDNQNSDLETECNSDSVGFLESMTDWYFRPHDFESSELYESLGILPIKKVTDWIGKGFGERVNFRNHYRLWDETIQGLKEFDYKTRISEALHLVGVGISLSYGVHAVIKEDLAWSIIDGLFLVANTYLVMLQRYNRGRLYDVIERMEQKSE